MRSFTLMASIAALMLASCGGSKLDVDGGSTPTGTGLALTAANAESVAATSFNAAMNSVDLAEVGGVIGVTAASPGTINKASTARQYSGFLSSVLQKIPFGPDIYPCDTSGTLTISGDIADPLTLTAGDSFSIDANACNDGLGEVLDGLMSMTITDFSGDLFLQSYLLGMDVTLTGLQVTTATDRVSSSGDTAVILDTTASPFVSAAVSGTSMATSSNSSTQTLSDYQTDQTVDAGQQGIPYTLAASGTLSSSSLSSTVRYSTPVPFAGFDAGYPDTGEMLILGNNSSARLVALDNVNVRIDIDSDGNGSVDQTILTTWAELQD